MVILNGTPWPNELLDLNVTRKLPVLVGIPVMRPVVPLKVSPVGRVPVRATDVAFAVRVGTKEKGVPTVPSAVELLVNAGEPVTVTNQLSESITPSIVVPFLVVTLSE
jgi:hypothetical protein